jgi:hypothetical protein
VHTYSKHTFRDGPTLHLSCQSFRKDFKMRKQAPHFALRVLLSVCKKSFYEHPVMVQRIVCRSQKQVQKLILTLERSAVHYFLCLRWLVQGTHGMSLSQHPHPPTMRKTNLYPKQTKPHALNTYLRQGKGKVVPVLFL